MLKGKNLICLGNNMWESNFTNTVSEIMIILSKDNNILYVDYPFTLKDLWMAITGHKYVPYEKMLGIEPRLRDVRTRINSSIHVLSPPPVIPMNRLSSHNLFKKLLSLNAGIVERQIQKAINTIGMMNPIVVSAFNPYYGTMLAGKLKEDLNIYYCYDEIADGWHKHHGPLIEKDYIQKTDLIITTSEHLFHRKKCIAPNCYLIKNGVDFLAFSRYSQKEKVSGKKVVGYIGSIDHRFDVETMTYAIQNLPEAEFHFAGRIADEKAYNTLCAFSNTRWLGTKKPGDVPEITGNIDLGIVPYLENEFTKNVYPLKFNEYLAAGKPVVSTTFALLPEFKEVIRFTSSKEDFLAGIKNELEQDNEFKKKKRMQFAADNSWQKRAEEFSFLIENELEKKNRTVYPHAFNTSCSS